MIYIIFDKRTVVAGDRISGRITYTSQDSPKITPKKATVNLFWRTEGRGTPDKSRVESLPIDPARLSANQAEPFSFTTPYEGPITYNGSLLRIIWEVKTILIWPGLIPKREKIARPFTVISRQS